ncbi:MAG TPA: ATP-dependent DNA helicase UvrD2 [Actinomycetes bacterium]|nr:ATP-dependent DNA helicase UvrD2 [Actinomycetes bacterium]
MTAATLSEVLVALDPEQHAVATAPRGPVRVLAGAGSGKTRALTHRIAAMASSGLVDPRHVLALTFTARAAGELRGRLRRLGVDGVQARTFHAAALRQLRYFWQDVVGGSPPEVSPTKAPLIAESCKRLRVRVEATALRDLAAEIEWAKVSEVSPDDYAKRAAAAGRGGVVDIDANSVARIYAGYEAVKRDRGVIDFEDVLLLSAGMLSDDASMMQTVQSQYRSLLVDEYQDVSPIQQRLLDLWLGDRDDITVVGDPNQTIYSFAGATSRFLNDFPTRFPNASTFVLERNYRSTPEVVHVANQLLSATGKPAVVLKSQREKGPAPVWLRASDESAEVNEVVERIRSLAAGGVPYREMAVLYRINAQSVALEEALTEANVPYSVRGGERFFDRREVKETIALLRGAARADSDDAAGTLTEQVTAVLSTKGYQPAPPPGPSQARDRWESLAALVTLAREVEEESAEATLPAFVDELKSRASAAHAPTVDAVTLSTLHAAKGLEWNAVFLVGLTDGMVPISYATSDEHIAEERRLLYVGITRAKEHLTFSYARGRTSGDRRQRQPSRFLRPLNPEFGGSEAGARPAGRAPRTASCRVCGRTLTTASERKLRRCSQCGVDVDDALFESLRQWRKQTADQASVPAFVVFTDATLLAIAVERPTDASQLLQIPGIGHAKAERYGPGVLQVLKTHASTPPAITGKEHAG